MTWPIILVAALSAAIVCSGCQKSVEMRLKDPDRRVRKDAIHEAWVSKERYVADLIVIQREDDGLLSLEATEALARLGGNNAIKAVLAKADEGKLGHDFQKLLFEDIERLAVESDQNYSTILSSLVAMIDRHPDDLALQTCAINTLAEIGPPAGPPLLSLCLKHKSKDVRLAATGALKRKRRLADTDNWIELYFQPLTKSPDPWARWAANEILLNNEIEKLPPPW